MTQLLVNLAATRINSTARGVGCRQRAPAGVGWAHVLSPGGAALYTHEAFGIHFLAFIVAFAVVCSGIASASTSANTLAQNFFGGLAINGVLEDGAGSGVTSVDTGVVTLVAMSFMVLLALINLRGVGESVKFNVVLTSSRWSR